MAKKSALGPLFVHTTSLTQILTTRPLADKLVGAFK